MFAASILRMLPQFDGFDERPFYSEKPVNQNVRLKAFEERDKQSAVFLQMTTLPNGLYFE